MSNSDPYADLQVSEDPVFTSKGWIFERLGWLLLASMLVAALAGVFGGGPVSQRTTAGADGLFLTYERYGRRVCPTELLVHLPPQSADQARIWIDRRYLSACQIEKISPAPVETRLGSDRLIFVFPRSTDEGAEVAFRLEPQEFGFLQGRLGMDEGEPLAFDQFIYP